MMTPRQKWHAFLRGEDVGPMVAPLVDDWSLAESYAWPYAEPDPYPPGHPHHAFSQQMAMAHYCGYDPLFYVWLPIVLREPITTHSESRTEAGTTITETRTWTPYGDLHAISETAVSTHTLKSELETEADYQKVRWLIAQEKNVDVEATIRRGQELLAPVGERGVVGMWWGAPGVRGINREDLFCHIADFPDLYREALEAQFQVDYARLELMRAMGYDFLFYCVDGTEWISPGYFEEFILPYTQQTLARWRELGGFVVWHSCGHITEFLKRGYYNQALPEIFETMSEPPVGNLPSLRWAREQLDPRITTKGNVDLQLLHDGPEEAIRAEVRRVKAETAGYRHIVGASDDILHGTPLAHLRAFVDESRKEAESLV